MSDTAPPAKVEQEDVEIKEDEAAVNVDEKMEEEPVEAEEADAKVEEPTTEVITEAPEVPKLDGMSEEEVVEMMLAASRQVYFYFSDSNLPVDKYFFSLTACNKEGWVPIKTIGTFTRMRPFSAKGADFIATALRTAIAKEGSGPLLAVSEDGLNVRRAKPLEPKTDVWSRTVYVKGFGEGDSKKTDQAMLEKYMNQFGTMNAVRKRRADDPKKGTAGYRMGAFKGSVYAEFASISDCKKFCALKTLPKFTPDGPDMLFMSKEAYVQMKAKEKGIDARELKRSGPSKDADKASEDGASEKGDSSKTRDNKPRGFNAFREMDKLQKGGVPKLARIPDDVAVVGQPLNGFSSGRDGKGGERKRKAEDDGNGGGKSAKREVPTTVTFNHNGQDLIYDGVKKAIVNEADVKYAENSAVKMVGRGPNADYKELKEEIRKVGFEPFIAYPPGAEHGALARQDRETLDDESFAKLQAAELKYGGASVTLTRCSDAEVKKFWLDRALWAGGVAYTKETAGGPRIKDSRDRKGNNNHGRGGGRGGRGGRGGGGRGGGRGGRNDRNKEKAGGAPADNGGMPPMVATGPA